MALPSLRLGFSNVNGTASRVVPVPLKSTRSEVPLKSTRSEAVAGRSSSLSISKRRPTTSCSPNPNNDTNNTTVEEDRTQSPVAEVKVEVVKKRKEDDFWSGVSEEIKEIEWPVFTRVLGTTGVVLAVIAGSSVVLLTVNALLSELSDRVFAGKGLQDFFS